MPTGYSLPEDTENISYAAYRDAFEWDLPEQYNIARACLSGEDVSPGDVALRHVSESFSTYEFTYRDLNRASDRFAGTLAAWGIGSGDQVALCCPSSPELLVAHLATYKRGAVAVPISVLLGADAVAYTLTHSGADVLVIDEQVYRGFDEPKEVFADVDRVVEISLEESLYTEDAQSLGSLTEMTVDEGEHDPVTTTPDTPALILYTSGTGGRPKGVLHGHRYLIGSLPGYHLWFHLFEPEHYGGQRVWTPSEWAWAGALFDVVFPTLAIGGTVVSRVRRSGFDPATALSFIDEQRVTRAFFPPTALTLIREEVPEPETNLPSLKVVQSGGEQLNPAVQKWAETEFDLIVNEGYGQTEANALVGNCQALFDRKEGSMGRAYPGHSINVIDDDGSTVDPNEIGELTVESPDPVMFIEYWDRPELTSAAFTENGALKTGDMVVYDEENFIYFQCRKDELIISSGYRISPVEIEKVIESDPRVLEAVVGGVEDDVGRTRIEAHVLPAGDATNANSLNDEIVELVRERLGAHKAPDRVILLKNLPQTRSGKVDRSVIFD